MVRLISTLFWKLLKCISGQSVVHLAEDQEKTPELSIIAQAGSSEDGWGHGPSAAFSCGMSLPLGSEEIAPLQFSTNLH